MSENTTNSTKRMTPEQLARHAEYLRAYRKRFPERCARWRDNWVLKRAEKLRAQAEAVTDDGEH